MRAVVHATPFPLTLQPLMSVLAVMSQLAVVLLPLWCTSCSSESTPAAPTQTSTGRAFAELLPDGKGLAKVAKIRPGLYRGSQPTAEGYKTLKEMGFKTVICLRRFNSGEKEVEAAGMEYVAIPIHADVGSTPPSDEQVKLFFDTVLDPARQPVYFHCKHGVDRTGTMAAIYRLERDGWNAKEAVEELQAFGYHDIFKDLIAFVRAYEPRGFKSPR